jgi:GNAT superfamily N-acetyltransferase
MSKVPSRQKRFATARSLRFQPLTAGRWADFEALFGPRGACAGCWCMWWRTRSAEYRARTGDQNKQAMRRLVRRGEVTGLLAYDGERAVGWVSVAPRERYVRLETARTLKPVDDRPVWSAVCFFVSREYRGQGLTVKLLRAAGEYAASEGATLLEGYPVDPGKKWADAYAFTGLVASFERAGFREVARPSKTRAIVRKELRPRR